jgi:prepilin signal peptidase PulO-like enzyme (type II secretory pathway)
MYISRLIVICLGAVLSPFIFLLMALPKTADLADLAIKGYLVSVFTVFIHVVTIQLAGSFLTLPEQTSNSLISVAVAIGLLLTLLKTPSFLMQLIFASSRSGVVKKMGNQIMNVMSTDNTSASLPRGNFNQIVPRKMVKV